MKCIMNMIARIIVDINLHTKLLLHVVIITLAEEQNIIKYSQWAKTCSKSVKNNVRFGRCSNVILLTLDRYLSTGL